MMAFYAFDMLLTRSYNGVCVERRDIILYSVRTSYSDSILDNTWNNRRTDKNSRNWIPFI